MRGPLLTFLRKEHSDPPKAEKNLNKHALLSSLVYYNYCAPLTCHISPQLSNLIRLASKYTGLTISVVFHFLMKALVSCKLTPNKFVGFCRVHLSLSACFPRLQPGTPRVKENFFSPTYSYKHKVKMPWCKIFQF